MEAPAEYLKETWAILVDNVDSRVEKWMFMSSFWPLAFLLSFYVYFCTSLGPSIMKNRKPFDLKTPIIVYNIFQIVANAYLVFESFRLIWLPGTYNLFCENLFYGTDTLSMIVAVDIHFFFMLKISDLADTVFMVLRKKNRQISFLHIYHHTGMVVAGWVATKYLAGGHVVFFGTVNCTIHAIMYTYYLCTAISPEMKQSIWWKRHLTELQLFQFIIVGLHSVSGIIYPECRFPKFPLALFAAQNLFMFVLFWDFYVKTYLSRPKKTNNVRQD